MEHIVCGDLAKHLKNPWLEWEIREAITQLLLGLEIMHSYGIVHRDLKPENILVVSKTPEVKVKITDFGISKRLSCYGTTVLGTFGIGTEKYKAPEVLVSSQRKRKPDMPANIESRHFYTNKADLWSLGCVIFRMANKTELFACDAELENKETAKSKIENVGGSLGRDGIGFLKKLLVLDPDYRCNASQALEELNKWPKPAV
ncbi:hypothetical protein ABKA04_008847 [Annulohypoxylon sp. FPYF3050]